ncbi:MAG: amidase family protein [Pseudomonadota bacterium]|nr:amidase family protein [Pseudomonadota bacterium]
MTSEQAVEMYLRRIELLDGSGPRLRSVIAINPHSLEQAKESDERRLAGVTLGPLDGVPVLIKDNIETRDPMPTTAGSSALLNNFSEEDSPVIAKLRSSGAIILGKTNLSQWANFRSTHSISGWSSVGGQVKNPHILDRSPCGSSSGSAVAISARLAPLALGTETNGSIICPAHVNGIVGFKPTVGLLPTDGIVPISKSQDTAGPMTRTVGDAMMLMDALTGSNRFSQAAPVTMKELRIGVLRFAQGDNRYIKQQFDEALIKLSLAGATLVDIDAFQISDADYWRNELFVLEIEFADSLNRFLRDRADRLPVDSLDTLIDFNLDHRETELALFDQEHFVSATKRPAAGSAPHKLAVEAIKAASGQNGIDQLLNNANVDVLVAPSGPLAPPIDLINGDVWPAWVGAGYLAAIAGYPHLTLPMGVVKGLPLGISVMGAENTDSLVLTTGKAIEQVLRPATVPRFTKSATKQAENIAAVEGTGTSVK